MSAVVDKNVQISIEHARRLKQLASEWGVKEDKLIEEGLDLLFRKQAIQLESEADEEDDMQLLARLEAENGPVQYNTRPVHRIDRDKIVSIVETTIDPRSLRRTGE